MKKSAGFIMVNDRRSAATWLGRLTCAWMAWGIAAVAGAMAYAAEVDHAMYADPKLPETETKEILQDGIIPLWLDALTAPEADLRRQAADAIAQAHRAKLADLSDCAPQLAALLNRADDHPAVRLSVMRALVAIDARQAAEQFFRILPQEGLHAAQIMEPALAEWDYEPMREVWLRRLDQQEGSQTGRLLAMRGLAAVGEVRASAKLQEIAANRSGNASLRLEAARALGKLQTSGLEPLAKSLIAGPESARIIDRLVAAELLGGHAAAEAAPVLLQLAVDDEPTVAAVALTRLLATDPQLVAPLAAEGVKNPDANVRRLYAEALVAQPTLAALQILGPLLDDPHPDVRSYAADSLIQLAEQQPLEAGVINEAAAMLETERWRGLEQAALVLGALDHEPAAERLIELLSFERPEVMVAAAWGLRRLAVPETLPAMLQHAEEQTEKCRQRGWQSADDRQLVQLFQAFGSMNYREAEPLMRQFVPKTEFYGYKAREAAVWALGKLHVDDPQEDLAAQLEQRLTDSALVMAEFYEVKIMAAVSLGRMNAESALPSLRRVHQGEGPNMALGQACGWAIEQITGEASAPPQTNVIYAGGWFLQPIN